MQYERFGHRLMGSPDDPRPRLRILYRYVFGEVLSPTLLAFLLYTFLMLMNQFFLLADYAYRFGVPLGDLGSLFALQLPHVVVLTLPMALLVGFLVAAARLASDSELVALAASGISFSALLRPVLHLALAFCLLTGALMYDWMPRANARISTTFLTILRQNLVRNIQPREFNSRLLPGFTLYVHDVESRRNREIWRDVVLDNQPAGGPDRRREIYFARQAWPEVDEQAGVMVIQLSDVTIHSWTPPGNDSYDVRAVARYSKRLPPPPILAREAGEGGRSVRERTVPELLEQLHAEAGQSEFTSRLVRLEIHKRFAIPFACIVFAFLGLGLGATARRSGRAFAFVTSLLIILGYYQTFYVGERLAVEGHIAPWLSMWAGNLVFGALGVYLFIQRATEGRYRLGAGKLADVWRSLQIRFVAWQDRRRSQRTDPRARARRTGVTRLLDRYVLSVFLRMFGLVCAAGLVLYVQVTLFQLLDDILRHHIPVRTVVRLYAAWLPEMLTYCVPVSVLVGTVIAFSLLTRTNEVTAMLVSGISLYRIALPVIAAGLMITAGNLWLYDSWLPRSAERFDLLSDEVRGLPPQRHAPARWTTDRAGTTLLHFGAFDARTSIFHRLSIFELADARQRLPTSGSYARQAHFSDGELILDDGWVRHFSGAGLAFESFSERAVEVQTNQMDMVKEWRKPRYMPFAELAEYARTRTAASSDLLEVELELYTRRAHAFLPLVMLLVGLPFAFAIGRRGSFYGVGVAIGLAMVYFAATAIAVHLGKLGVLPIPVAAWSPNVAFGLLGLTGFLNLRT